MREWTVRHARGAQVVFNAYSIRTTRDHCILRTAGYEDLPKGQRLERHQQISNCNERLQPHLTTERAKLERRLAEVEKQIQIDNVLGSREFSFCLFPESILKCVSILKLSLKVMAKKLVLLLFHCY